MSLLKPELPMTRREKIALAVIKELFGGVISKAESDLIMGVPHSVHFQSPSLEVLARPEEAEPALRDDSSIVCAVAEDMQMACGIYLEKNELTPEMIIRINPGFFQGSIKQDIARIVIGQTCVAVEPLPNPNNKRDVATFKRIEWQDDDDKDVLRHLIAPVINRGVKDYLESGVHQQRAYNSHMGMAFAMAAAAAQKTSAPVAPASRGPSHPQGGGGNRRTAKGTQGHTAPLGSQDPAI